METFPRSLPQLSRQFRDQNNSQRHNKNRTGGANNEYRGGPGGPGTGFCSPGVVLVVVNVVASHYVY